MTLEEFVAYQKKTVYAFKKDVDKDEEQEFDDWLEVFITFCEENPPEFDSEDEDEEC